MMCKLHNAQRRIAENMTKETVEALLASNSLPEDVREALLLRQSLSKSSTKKLDAMLATRDMIDNRVRNTMAYHGASTGRWSGRLIQVQNFPRGTLDNVDEAINDILTMGLTDLQAKYGDVMEVISSCLRGMLVPRKGNEFIVADYGAIEARIIMWYAGEEEALETFRAGDDIYKEMASAIFNKPVNDISKNERQLGKAAVLGAGFSMGPSKFKLTVNSQTDLNIDDATAIKVIKAYRTKYPNVPLLWKNIEAAAIEAVTTGNPVSTNKVTWFHDRKTNFLTCTLPSGRNLYYYDPKLKIRWALKWIDTSKVFHFDKYESKSEAQSALEAREDDPKCARIIDNCIHECVSLTHMGVNTNKQFVRQETYGGKLVENCIQATARDCMVEGLFRVEEKNYLTIMTIHDEVVTEVPEGSGSVEEFENLLAQTPTWADGLPLVAEGWRGKRYRK
jgi:DNA polymerase